MRFKKRSAEMYNKSGSRWEEGEGETGKGWAGFLRPQSAEVMRGHEGAKKLRLQNPFRMKMPLITWRSNDSNMQPFPYFHSSCSLRAGPELSPRSPVRIQRISLSSLQNVGTVTLKRVVFSRPADPP